MTCAVAEATIQSEIFTNSGNYAINWTTTDGNILSGSNTTSPAIDQEGVYTFTVLNLSNGCASTDLVQITENVLQVKNTKKFELNKML